MFLYHALGPFHSQVCRLRGPATYKTFFIADSPAVILADYSVSVWGHARASFQSYRKFEAVMNLTKRELGGPIQSHQ